MQHSLYEPLINQQVTVRLSTEITITGKLVSIDGYVNVALEDCQVEDKGRMAAMVIRGSCIDWVKVE